MFRDFFCLFRRSLDAGTGVFLVVLCFCGNALADSSDIFELSAGEMVFSQRAQFYDVEVGGLVPLPVFSSGSQPAYVHFFAAGSVINFDQPATGSTPGINGITDQSYTGVIPAVGLRIPATWGYWEGDVGGAFFNVDETLTPVTSIADVYLQTELFLNQAGPGSLDLFGSYIGGINYLFGMGRYMLEAGHTSGRKVLFFAGPEVIAQDARSGITGQKLSAIATQHGDMVSDMATGQTPALPPPPAPGTPPPPPPGAPAPAPAP